MRLRLQIDPEGKITLVAPWRAVQRQIDTFVLRHESWIRRHLERLQQQRSSHPSPLYQQGDSFLYFGETLTLCIEPSPLKRPRVKLREDRLTVFIHPGILGDQKTEAVRKAVFSFYRRKAEETIHDRLRHFNAHYGFRYRRVTLRDPKTRWGSCSRAGNLSFSWRLIMAPIEVIDFVVVHELCHLREMNHSSRFWALVAETAPHYKEARRWLRENHPLLKI